MQCISIHFPVSIYVAYDFFQGYDRKKGYCATQVPLASTANDFWQFIYDEKCPVIVCLQTDAKFSKVYSMNAYCFFLYLFCLKIFSSNLMDLNVTAFDDVKLLKLI